MELPKGLIGDDWQRLDDFCREIGRCRRSGKNYCDQGLVEWSRLGNQIFIKRSSVGRLLEERKRGGNLRDKGRA